MRSQRQVSAYRNKIHSYARTKTWADRSLRFRAAKGYRCFGCGKVSKANHAHHLSYDNAFSGREPDTDLMCLCSACHRKVHEFARANRGMSLRAATYKALKRKRGILQRLFG